MADPSLLRQSIRRIVKGRCALENDLMGAVAPMVGASLVQYRIKCGKAVCNCRKGKGHGPYSYLSAKVKGRTRLKLIPKEMAERAARAVGRYRDYQMKLRLIRRLNKDIVFLFKRLRNLLLAGSPYRFP